MEVDEISWRVMVLSSLVLLDRIDGRRLMWWYRRGLEEKGEE